MNFDLKFFWGNLGVIDKLSPKYLVLAQTSGKKCPTLQTCEVLQRSSFGRGRIYHFSLQNANSMLSILIFGLKINYF